MELQSQKLFLSAPQRGHQNEDSTERHALYPSGSIETVQQTTSTTTLGYDLNHCVNGVTAANSHDLDSHSTTLSFPQHNISSARDGLIPSAEFDFPTDFWFQGLSPSFSNILATESSPTMERAEPTPSTIYGASPYASCPLFHVLETEDKTSPTKTMASICDLLQNRKSWKRIQELSARQSSNDVRSLPTVNEQTRDALVAITHITLSKHMESACVRNMPLSFPPLETVQSLFRSCFARFARLYPIIHPKTFETAAEMEREGVTYPIFLQNIMILGAMLLSVKEGQAFASELAYLVRKGMNDVMAQDVLTTDDVWMLSSTILITASGVWSGNKVHVELAEAYRGSYTTVSAEDLCN